MANNKVLRHLEKLVVTMCRWQKQKMKCFRFVINKCGLKF